MEAMKNAPVYDDQGKPLKDEDGNNVIAESLNRSI